MALPEDEQRRLAEIESGLAEEDPRLARRFSRGRQPVAASTLVAVIVSAVLMLGAGVVVMVFGARLDAPLVVVIGGIIAVAVPAMVWLVRR